jgi:O-antigen/teichoic acid export membrane protein
LAESLTDRTISGFNWSFIGNNAKTIISLVAGIILARLLMPEDFGLLGMTYIFISFAELFVTLGISLSVQRIKDLTEEHIRTATTITIISSLIVYFILWFSAPWIAEFYNEDRIIPVLRTLSTLFIIQGYLLSVML